MCRCLYELKRFKESQECLNIYKSRFPNQAKEAVATLENDLTKASSEPSSSTRKSSESGENSRGSSSRSSREPRTRRNFLIRFQRSSSERSNSNDEGGEGSPTRREDSEPVVSLEDADSRSSMEAASADIDSGDDGDSQAVIDSSESEGSSTKNNKRPPPLLEYEKEYKEHAVDYETRFCGHCNTTTDIKEANFFGDFVVAGSDDGSFFVWDRETTNIVKIIKGDESIVNCLQPHPSTCCLATSGIESVVRIWTPMPEVI